MGIKIDKKHLSILYLDYVKTCDCIITLSSIVDRSHMKAVGTGRNREKPMKEHLMCVPMRRDVHTDYGNMTVDDFNEKWRCDVWELAARFMADFWWKFSNGYLNEMIINMTKYQDGVPIDA